MRLLAAALLLLQSADPNAAPGPAPIARTELRAGLDTLYGGNFAAAVSYFSALASRDSTDPAPLIFHAGAYIWWAAAKDSDGFAADTIDSLLNAAIRLARAGAAGPEREFWLATALGYRARERELHGHAWGAAKDAKAMRDAYRKVLAADSTCADCWLGLGLYSYGLARVGTLAKLVAKLIGLGSGNAEEGIAMLHRVAAEGDLARTEAAWVLASALTREAERDRAHRAMLRAEAGALVGSLSRRYPGNPVFQRFLAETSEPAP